MSSGKSAMPATDVATLLSSVRNGTVTGVEFCAELSRLNPADRARAVSVLLRDYKDLNNFTPATHTDTRAESTR